MVDQLGNRLIEVDGIDLRSDAYNVATRTGRYSMPTVRGENLVLPGASGSVFSANKPFDVGIGALAVWAVGATTGSVEVSRNLIRNPSVETNTTDWSFFPGTGGTAALTQGTDGGVFSPSYARVTWSVASTNGADIRVHDNANGSASVSPGDVVSASMYVRPSVTRSMRLIVGWKNSSNIDISGTGTNNVGPTVTCTGGVWTLLKCEGATAPANVDHIAPLAQCAAAPYPQAGETIDGDAAIAVKGSTVPDYFDGTSFVGLTNLMRNPAVGSSNSGWSTSTVGMGAGVTNARVASGGPTASLPSFNRATVATGVTPASGVDMLSIGVTSWTSASIPAVSDVIPGLPYTTSLWVRSNRPQMIKIQHQYVKGSGGAINGQINGPDTQLAVNVWTRFSLTSTAPADAQALRVDIDAGLANVIAWNVGDTLDATGLVMTQGSTVDYFDGSTADTVYWDYGWTGTANNSTSTAIAKDADQSYAWTGTAHASPSTRSFINRLIIPDTVQGRRQALEDNIARLQRLFTRRHRLSTIRAAQPDGSIRRADVEWKEWTEPEVQAGGTRAEWSIAFEIPGVWWRDETQTTQATTPSATLPQNLDLTNFTDMTGVLEDAVLTVTGAITNPRITDAETGAWVQYTGTVAAGQSWVVDVGAFTSLVNGVSQIANTTHAGGYRLLSIPNCFGANNYPRLTLSGSGGSAATSLSVAGYRKWVSG